MIGLTDRDKPLRSKILAVPKYRKQYLQNLKTLAETSLNWESLGPFVASLSKLVDDSVKAETRALVTYEGFVASTSGSEKTQHQQFGPPKISLQEFVEGRQEFLLNYQPKGSNQ